MDKELKENALAGESSPYLLQHAENPVNWYPWGEDALTLAKNSDKPLLISIGYSACHWCHVMEKESFTNDSIAAFMNENFINIKVDREERPDIDQIYMDAVQLISGRGGWPLNAFALPDGRPFYAGTYFPPTQWKNLLFQIAKLHRENHPKVLQSAEKLTSGIQQDGFKEYEGEVKGFTEDQYASFFKGFERDLDMVNGGFGFAPKFPLPSGISSLFHQYFYTGNHKALKTAELTLSQMARGGIHDQVGGGFARYSVDEKWKVPHFEKMLYDNGQLLSVYSQACQISQKPLYKKVISGIVQFLKEELQDPSGGFYSALDADSEGIEGKYYAFTDREFQSILTENEYPVLRDHFSVSKEGNWEENLNILHQSEPLEVLANRHNLSIDQLESIVEQGVIKLKKEREGRVKPGLDDKILASWNGMALKGLVDAYRCLKNEEIVELALNSARFLRREMMNEEVGIFRSYKEGKAKIPGFLDDLAFVAEAFIELYQLTAMEKWLDSAVFLCEFALKKFYHPPGTVFFYTSSDSEKLIARKAELLDNVIPSSNSVMANNLFKLGKLLHKPEWLDISEKMLNTVVDKIPSGGPYTARWSDLYGALAHPFSEVVITGPQALEKLREINGEFLPNVVLLAGVKSSGLTLLQGKIDRDETRIFICQNNTCKPSLTDLDLVIKMVEPKRGRK